MKNKKVVIISSIILVIVLVAIILGILYFTTDLFKTNKQLFVKYMSQIDIKDENLIQKYNIANDKLTTNSSSSVTNIDIGTSIQNENTGIADIQKILNIKSNGLKNVNFKQEYRDFILSSNEQQFLTLKYMRDDNTYAIMADNILSKYLAVENANLKELFGKLGVQDTSTIPNSIPANYDEILKVDEETLKTLKQTYGTLLYNNINEENFYKINNEDNTQTIGLSLTQQETFNILKLVLETAKSDTALLNLIISKAQLLGYADITGENILAEIQKYIDEINNNEYSNEKDFLKVSLIKKDKLVIRFNLETNHIEYIEEYENPMDDGFTETEKKVNNKVEIDFSKTNEVVILVKENDTQVMKIVTNSSYDDSTINCDIEVEYSDGEEKNHIKAQYQINNYQTDNITQSYIIYIDSNNTTDYQISISNETTLKQDITIEKLTTENSAKLNDMTSEELSALFTAIMARIMSLYGAQINTLSI